MHRAHTKERDYQQWEEACHVGERNVADSITAEEVAARVAETK